MHRTPPRLIGMVHLLPLPGSPRARPLDEVLARARRDADLLVQAGFGGVMVENYGDVPFRPDRVEPVTVAAMTRAVAAVAERLPDGVALGVNVLRNDARSALAVAGATGASMIRVNVHTGSRVTDQGPVSGRAWETLRLREAWGLRDIAILADVAVKHSAPLGPERPVEDETADLVQRGLADAVLVTGGGTGKSVDAEHLERVRAAAGVPVLVASGVSPATVRALLVLADGVIVGTSIKRGGRTAAEVDPDRARALVVAAG